MSAKIQRDGKLDFVLETFMKENCFMFDYYYTFSYYQRPGRDLKSTNTEKQR